MADRGHAFAPVALFTYKRLTHLERTVDALRASSLATETDLVVFSDGPSPTAPPNQIDGIRRYLRGITGFKSLTIVERPTNVGLAASIIDGVTEVLKTRDTVIVVEDDLVTSPHFLTYMNDGLRTYAHQDRVWSVHGYVHPVDGPLPETFFVRGGDNLGWGTWRRAWRHFEPDARKLLRAIKDAGLTHAFNRHGACRYTRMLAAQVPGRYTSWAIRWHASVFLAGGLTLYPGRSLVNHIGNDETGTNFRRGAKLDVALSDTPITVEPMEPVAHDAATRLIEDYYQRTKTTPWQAVGNRVRDYLGLQ
jgi:hypothetical protein